MAVKIGNASISENGTIRGSAGDQTGREVTTRSWYRHSKGWVTLRCLIPGMAESIARAMEMACANDDIGYDQYQNGTLWDDVAPFGYDPSQTTQKVETDCARLVRVCVQYACVKMGIDAVIPDFYTATLANVLVKTGLFEKLTDSKYNTQDAYLERGMVQVTKTKGHAWVILENGKRAGEKTESDRVYALGERTLRNGMEGADVRELQSLLIQMGYDLGSWGADGDFGDATEMALRQFQQDEGLEVDGVAGKDTFAALLAAGNEDEAAAGEYVLITGGNCYIRSAPNTGGGILGVARKGENLEYLGETSENGWLKLRRGEIEGYVSGKYGKRTGE